jgi:DNA-binding CsgD family transcriptional regulator/tetratricopeptide (TPR) repeat protein
MLALAGDGLIGRDAELSILDGLLGGLLAGRGGVAWVEGEPGIGKSALVSALAREAESSGCAVRFGTATDLTASFPLRLMADCLGVGRGTDPMLTEIARLLCGESALPGTAEGPPVAGAAERMLEVVDHLCVVGPVLVVAEDLHWADEASLALWSRLARSVDQVPLLLVGTCRPIPRRQELARLSATVRDVAGSMMVLNALAPDAVVEAALHRLGTPPGPGLIRELARTGGNPFYLRELVDAWMAADSVTVLDGLAELAEGASAVPESLVGVLGQRLGFLSDRTLRALRLAALSGTEIAVAQWATALGCSVVDLDDVVTEATAAGVLIDADRGLAFRHDLIRQVLVAQTPAALRTAIHRDAARRLVKAGHPADEVARHLAASPELDDWAFTWLASLPESVAFATPQAFRELFERATAQVPAGDNRWEPLAVRSAQTGFWLGADDSAAETAVAVVRGATDPELSGQMRVQAIRVLGRLRRFDEARRLAEDGLQDPRIPPRWRARLRALASQVRRAFAESDAARQLGLQALQEATACADAIGVGYAHNALLWCTTGPERIAHAEQALAVLGADPDSADLRALLINMHLQLQDDVGDPDRFDAQLPKALLAAERLGTASAFYVPATASDVCYRRGEWDEMLRYAAMIPDTIEVLVSVTFGRRAEVAMRRGEREAGESYLRALGVLDESRPPFGRFARELASPLMLLAELQGDYERALAHGRDQLEQPIEYVLATCGFMQRLIRLALAVGDRATAEGVVTTAKRVNFIEEVEVRCLEALLDDDPQKLLVQAARYGERRWRVPQAVALEEAAVRLAAAGELDQARAALTQAVQSYTDFGAVVDVQRAQSRLRAFAVRVGPRSLRRRATNGWDALTPAEQRVAELVREGLSNPDVAARLYVSRATVQTHVSRILAKLGMRSRVELIRTVDTSRANGPAPSRP